ncbi:hypothetical protein LCGC14_1488420 [marine sediment metagenome]|uniref:Uncharacterized protein n=1 Tax=marine sediment metagenome TaxID=412755 RepID=A0A0F9LMZ0_9ZZZZ
MITGFQSKQYIRGFWEWLICKLGFHSWKTYVIGIYCERCYKLLKSKEL